MLITFISAAYGQTEKGNLFIGHQNLMELNFVKNIYVTNSDADEKTTEYAITPIFGFFLAKGIAVGIIPSYRYFYEETFEHLLFSQKTNAISVTPFIRYYIGNKKFKPFITGGIGYKYFKTIYTRNLEPSEFSYSGSMVTYNLGGGLSYFIKDNISIDLGLDYKYSRFTGKLRTSVDNVSENDTKVNELNSYVSLVFYFHGKKTNKN
jgi:opacity protein-like surface antigen